MDESLAYPAAALQWSLDPQHHEFPAGVFKSIVVSNHLRVLVSHGLPDARVQLQPDALKGESILWAEYDRSRSLLLRPHSSDSIALINESRGAVHVRVAGNDRAEAHKVLDEIDRALVREKPKEETALAITFWHAGADGAETTIRQIELARWNDIAANYVGDTQARLNGLMDGGFMPEQTGGRLLYADAHDLPDIATKIGVELRNRYVLGYQPKNPQHDGKYHRIQVKVVPPHGLPPLRAFWRLGYYAPAE